MRKRFNHHSRNRRIYNRPLRCEPLEDRRMLSGVTVITHGYQLFGSLPDWPIYMAHAISERAPLGGEVGVYDNDSGNYRKTLFDGNSFTISDSFVSYSSSQEHILVFDWASESNLVGAGWAEAAGDLLFASLVRLVGSINDLSDAAWHFIGHSRGAVVNSEAIERFATYDVPVQHVTTLDPHDFDEAFRPFDETFRDWELGLPQSDNAEDSYGFTTWSNVGYADNFYSEESKAPVPNGRSAGSKARNVDLGSAIPSNITHSDVHAWYYGTIDTDATEDDGDGGQNIEDEWYPNATRFTDGWNYSRLGAVGFPPEMNDLSKYLPKWNAEADAIFNGDFGIGVNNDFNGGLPDSLPGWQQGDGAGAIVDLTPDGMLHLGETGALNFLSAEHNLLYFPESVTAVRFEYTVDDASADDKLVMRLRNDTGTTSKEFDLGELGTFTGELAANSGLLGLPGSVGTIEFQLNPGGVSIGSDIFIDNVELVLAPGPVVSLMLLSDPDQAGEPNNNAAFRVDRTGDASCTLTVQYQISGTATNGVDYTNTEEEPLSGEVKFLSGQRFTFIPIQVVDDAFVEGTETVIITLLPDGDYEIDEAKYSDMVTIFDDDLRPGDYDGNGVVNVGDYHRWRETFGMQVIPGSSADGNGNGIVDAADYVVWRSRSGTVPLGDGLIAHYTFDDTTGPVVDSVGSFHGTNFGASRGVPGRIGNAFQFDGVDDYVSTTLGNGVNWPNGITISLWVKSAEMGNSGLVVARGEGSGASSQFLGLNTGHINPDKPAVVRGVPAMNLAMGNPSEYYTVEFGSSINDNQWHHVAGSYDGCNVLSVYVDGVQVSRNVSVSQTAMSFDVFKIGWDDFTTVETDRYLEGKIDDVKIWNRALSATEVATLFSQAAPLDTTSAAQQDATKVETQYAEPLATDLVDAAFAIELGSTSRHSSTAHSSRKVLRDDSTESSKSDPSILALNPHRRTIQQRDHFAARHLDREFDSECGENWGRYGDQFFAEFGDGYIGTTVDLELFRELV
jgi:hypothetical protein